MQSLYQYRRNLGKLVLVILLGFIAHAHGSGKAFNTLVVVNTNSSDSVELGDYYAAAHGIPDHHICKVGIATNLYSVTTNQFYSLLLDPIRAHITNENLEGQIDFLVLCQELPTRINDTQGLTASLFYGPRYSGTTGCAAPIPFTANAYYQAEQAFSSDTGWNATNGFIAFHLMATNLVGAKQVADRGAAAQSTFPAGGIYLYMLGNQLRGIREQQFANTQFSFTSLPGLPISCSYAYYSSLYGITNVMGYQDGYATISSSIRTNNIWLDGAYSDHLTSYGGRIPKLPSPNNQDNVLDWMSIGATASFGTVNEPCTYLEKFPDPLMGFYYARGFTIGECYTMAVEAPYQGLFAGDPLAAPYAAPPVVSVSSHAPCQIVTGTVPIEVSAAAHSNGVPAASMEVYLDDRFHTNLISLLPTPGNQLSVSIGTHTNTSTVATNDSLFDAVSALADSINTDPAQIVDATASGDRLELIYTQFNHGGDNLPVTATVVPGTASAQTLAVGLTATNLFPSTYHARKMLYLYTNNFARAGDTLTCVITLTNDAVVSNTLVASHAESVPAILERLRTVIITNTTLMATNGVHYSRLANLPGNVVWFGALIARTPGPDGEGIRVDWTVTPTNPPNGLMTNFNFSSSFNDNTNDIRPRASVLFHVTPTNGILTSTLSLDTSGLTEGLHTLDFVARDGSAVAAASRLSLPLIICNASPQLSLLGTNGVAVTNGELASLSKGTDFGPVDQGKAVTNTYSLHNNGTAALAITGWTTNDTGAGAFQVLGIPSTIQMGGVSNFTVVFTPTNGGSFQASLNVDSDAILDQTNLLFAGTGIVYTLTVASEHGTANPSLGSHSNLLADTVLTNSISAPSPSGGTQLVCTGWSMVANEPASGSTTNFVMTVTNNAALTWLWTTNYWLEPAAGPNGSIDVTDAWQPGGVSTQITATADPYYAFTNWTGSSSSSNNPLALLMNTPKSIQANFIALLATNGTPQWWLARFGWTNDFDAAATNDIDNDGFFTWQEYISDTNPTNTDSFFPPLEATGSATNLLFQIDPTSTGRHYYMDVGTPITNAEWSNVTNAPGTGNAWSPKFTPPDPGIFFYRGRVTLPP